VRVDVVTDPPSARYVVWESVKFDGSPHRSVLALDLGTMPSGRWLFVQEGTLVSRPNGRDYHHPCDAVTLVPSAGLWTATWLVGWDPPLYVDVASQVRLGDDRIVTIDLDVDVVRRRDGSVEVLDLDEFELHRQRFGYPPGLVANVTSTARALAEAIRMEQGPFRVTPDAPPFGHAPT